MKANKFAKNDEGVSAVIGVILMVAITVILAAVIAAFVFGMVGGVNSKKNPAFTIKRTGTTTADVTFVDSGGASTVANLQSTQTGQTLAGQPIAAPTVGQTIQLSGLNPTGTHVVLAAVVDGSTQVVLDTTV